MSAPHGNVTVNETPKGVQVKYKDCYMNIEGDDKTGHIKAMN
jgi:hypothetical protein